MNVEGTPKVTLPLVTALLGFALHGCTPQQNPPAEVSEPRIVVAEGTLVGERDGNINVFRAIPYAAPPIGELRWRAPVPAAQWAGERDATVFGPSCVQPIVPPQSLYYDPPESTDEDCLTLNVWGPTSAENAPVIVWVHGGSLRVGGSSQPMYSGEEFARRGIVFVSINYRLGVLGWLAHPELSAESPDQVSGNYGLQDQIAALEWVRTNVSAVGGDPANVTIMGESAGALSASYLLSSPRAEGLFQKAIIQSVNSRNFPEISTSAHGLPAAEATGTELFAALEFDTLTDARRADAQTLTYQATVQRFIPQGTIDGTILPAQIIDTFDNGAFAKVPLLAGFNSGEVRSQRIFLPDAPAIAREYETAIAARYGDLTDDVLALYPSSDIENSMIAMLTHAIYGWATERLVSKTTDAGQPAFLYVFDHCYPAARQADLCAFHASELPFIFGAIHAQQLPANWPAPDSPHDRQISETLLEYWTSFAATGQPHSATGPDWQTYGTTENYLHIGSQIVAGTDPYPGMFELHETLVQQRREAGEAWFFHVGLAAQPRE